MSDDISKLIDLRGNPDGDMKIFCPWSATEGQKRLNPSREICGRFLMKVRQIPGVDIETVCMSCKRKVWIRVPYTGPDH